MPRTPRSPLSSIIAYAMSAPIAEVQQALETIKQIVRTRVEQGLKEPALPLKVARPRRKKKQPTAAPGPVEAPAPAAVVGRAQQEAADKSPLRIGTRGPGVGRRRPRPAVDAVPAAAAADAAVPATLPDQAVDPSHVE